MKRAYIFFTLLLVLLVIVFLVVRTYVSFEEREVQQRETKQLIAAELEKFKITVDSRIDESEQALLAKLDSLTQELEEPALGLDSLASDSTAVDTLVADSTAKATLPSDTMPIDSVVVGESEVIDTLASDVPTEQDNEIYIRYLKKRWALPGDLTKYELAVAKQEIMTEVGRDYEMSADEILRVIDKVYEYRKALKKEDN